MLTHKVHAATDAAAITPARRGFTLVELLIVVVILAVLAAIVVPQFTRASEETRENSVKMNLFRIRTQIEIYKEHHGQPPVSHETFAAQMTRATNMAGDDANPGTSGYPFGPYLTTIPDNAFTSNNIITDADPDPEDMTAWYYDGATGAFHANHSEAARAW